MAGKKYIAAKKLVDPKKVYSVAEAVDLAKKTSTTKFDSSIDIAIKLNVDTTKAEQQLRGTMTLPHYFGKVSRILVIDDSITFEQAKMAGADFFGGDEKIAEVKDGWLDFDVLITTPKFMPKISKLGKVLGPKGLMPNPKTNTVTTKVAEVVEDIKKGMVSYRNDSYGNIHTIIGKVSFDENKLLENLDYVVKTIYKAKPQAVKGVFIDKISISTTMGPGIKVDKNSFDF